MKKQTLGLTVASCLVVLSQTAWSASFVVRDIVVNGLERVPAGTVLTYLPARVGQPFDDQQSAGAAKALMDTGLFDDARIGRQGDVLVVNVVERPAIGEVNFKGNHKLSTSKLMEVLKERNIAKGDTFDKEAFQAIQQEIGEQYLAMGYYGVNINTTVEPLARNRVAVTVNVHEGGPTRIQTIKITGNQAFSESVLLKQLESGPRGAFTPSFLSSRDKYSKEKMVGDLENLTSFYRDRGYLDFQITSTDVTMSEDKRGIFVNIGISEGAQYRISSVSVANNSGLSEAELAEAVKIRQGQIFSQKLLEETRKGIADKLGARGFASAKIEAVPTFDHANNQVGITLTVDTGRRIYVRRIDIRGNNRTKDEVYRRELRQLESSQFSKEQIERSKVRLERLPYVEEASIEAEPVAGTDDQVDLIVTVKERSSNQFRIGAGYSQSEGVLFNVNLNQENFMGTGKQLNVNVDNSKVNKNYSISYTNPYYTPDGISRGFSVYHNKYNAEAGNVKISSYASNRTGASVNYTVPLGENDSVYFSVGGEKRKVVLGTTPSTEIKNYVAANGDSYNQIPATVSYVHDTRNRTIFPSEGQNHQVSLQVAAPGSKLQYQKLSYSGAVYLPVNDNVTFALKGKAATAKASGGTTEVPFFDKYYLGGIGSVRGFEDSTIGARDSNGDPLGGDQMVSGTAELQFPVPFAEDVKGLKMSTFVDAGKLSKDKGTTLSPGLRASAGVGVVWLSPIGPFEISYAKPIKSKPGDKEQKIQFSIGASF
jgi:outer membrane protein insertion porin family